MNDINIDRFSGEAAEPPVWGRCGYCGAAIHEGHGYFEHEGTNVCMECADRYAYSVFERDAVLKTAEKEHCHD